MAKIKEIIVQMDNDVVYAFTWEEAKELFEALKELFEKEKQETLPYIPYIPYSPPVFEPWKPTTPYYTPSTAPDLTYPLFTTISTSDTN